MVIGKILIACEYSGVVRDAFIRLGYDAISCDIIPTISPGPHIQAEVQTVIHRQWDLIIAHPPCTYLCNSGVAHLFDENGDAIEPRWDALDSACEFFNLFLHCECRRVLIENPIPHKYAVERLICNYHQKIQPYQFGHTETKSTCLWLKGLPKLKDTNNVKEATMKLPIYERQRMHWLPPSKDRGLQRSITYLGIAEAIAFQYGPLTHFADKGY